MAVIPWPDDIIIMSQRFPQLFEKQRAIPSDNGIDQIVNRADPRWQIQTELFGNNPGAYEGAVEDFLDRLDGMKNLTDMPIMRKTLDEGSWKIGKVTIDDDLKVVINGVRSEEGMPEHKTFLKLSPSNPSSGRSPRIVRVAEEPIFDGAADTYTMILQPRIVEGVVVAGDTLEATKVIRVRRIVNASEVWGDRTADFFGGATSFWKEEISF